jgi:transcription antitermination factor NusG
VSCDKNINRKRLRTTALRKFRYYVGADELSLDAISKDYIDDFLSWAVKGGSSPKTIELYRDALKCVFVEQFPHVEDQIKQAFKKTLQRRCAQTRGLNVEQLRSLAKADFDNREDLTQTRDLFLFCVYCGGLDYNAAKSITKQEVGGEYLTLPTGLKITLNLNIQAIITMYDVEDSDMLFPFLNNMSEVAYAANLKEIGERSNLAKLKDHHVEAKSWLAAAKELQIETVVMAACVYKRVDILTHYSGEVSDNQAAIDTAIKNVCNLVVDDTEHWYAMKLRDRVTPDRIQQLLCDNEHVLACRRLKTYYPMEDIKVRVGGKWKQDTKAFIKDVLFFRTKKRFVDPLFRIVRNNAWIFRQSNSPMSPYAVISQHDMENFQRAISQFTDDISVAIVENSDIKVGKRVRLDSGEFAGCEGIIEGEEVNATTPELRNFYIKFTSNNSFKFQIKVSESSLTILD